MKLSLYGDTPGWSLCQIVWALADRATRWGWSVEVAVGRRAPTLPTGHLFYTPCYGGAEAHGAFAARATTGLRSHVSYGGWFTDDPLDTTRLPKVPAHATTLYLYHLTRGLFPYLTDGIDADLFHPPRVRRGSGRALVVGWLGGLAYNAAIKLFVDRLLPAVRLAGAGTTGSDKAIVFRPMAVWDPRDAYPQATVAEYLREIDVLLCTSLSEGGNHAVLQAAASGCVIVSTPCGNAPELVQDPRLLVSWTPSDIARAIQLLAADRGLCATVAEQTRALIESAWAWSLPSKNESWQMFLTGEGTLPSPDPQTANLLDLSRRYREGSDPMLTRDVAAW